MERVYLTRRNLLTLLNKLDRVRRGEASEKTIIKNDTVHPKYPCSSVIMVTAVEDEEYYEEGHLPGKVHPSDEPRSRFEA